MEYKNKTIVDSFTIDEGIAKELSELLIKQSIRERILANLVSKPDEYEEMEKSLIEIINRIEVLKNIITNSVPEQYRTAEYTWNYDGYEISGCVVQIFK